MSAYSLMKLEKPRARLARARTHQARFGEIWSGFLDQDEPYSPSVHIDDHGEGAIYVYPAELPDELSLVFGEMLYQLRAALDSLVYEVAIIDSGKDPPPNAKNLEFPIRRSEASFKSVAGKIAPLSEQHRAMIESIQPYHAEYPNEAMQMIAGALERLNDWARVDRHRGMHAVASWGSNRNPLFNLPPGCSLEWLLVTPDGLLENEGEVARFKLAGWNREMEFEANPNFMIDITVDNAPPPANDKDTLSQRTQVLIASVHVTIEQFEETLG